MKRGEDGSRYSACIADTDIATNVPYTGLLRGIVEWTLHAAMARSSDENTWEQERLRREGLASLELYRDGKAVWEEAHAYAGELLAAKMRGDEAAFGDRNELNAELFVRIDRDLQAYWRRGGYETTTMRSDMKRLFSELERDAAETAAEARVGLVSEIVIALFPEILG